MHDAGRHMSEAPRIGKASVEALDAVLQERLSAFAGANNEFGVRSAAICIEAPEAGYRFDGAVGEARADTGAAMTAETPFHAASVAKTMTAVLILQVAERGLLGKDGIDSRLADTGAFEPAIIDRLHRINGVSYGGAITLRHLLTHTSGMKDAMVDDGGGVAGGEGPRPNALIGRIFSAPGLYGGKDWTPWDPSAPDDPEAGTLNFYLNADGISETALFQPGEAFHYSDTGYVVLALVAEALFGAPLHVLMERRIVAPLGLDGTYLAYRNDPKLGRHRQPEADVYAGDTPCLSSGLNLSFDWGGGGIVTTAGALNGFLIAVSQGAVFKDPETLDLMTGWRAPSGLQPPRIGVGCGLFKTRTDDLERWGHSGDWGGKMFFHPASGVYFSGSANQTQAPSDWHVPFMRDAIAVIEDGKTS